MNHFQGYGVQKVGVGVRVWVLVGVGVFVGVFVGVGVIVGVFVSVGAGGYCLRIKGR